MRHWLPPTFLLFYFLFYFINVESIELDFWSAEELMNARTLPGILGVLGLAAILLQLAVQYINPSKPVSNTIDHDSNISLSELQATQNDASNQSRPQRLFGGLRQRPLETHGRTLALVAFFLVYIFLIDELGFTIASIAFLLIAPWLLGHKRSLTRIGVSLGIPLGLAVLFDLLGIYLPSGQWLG